MNALLIVLGLGLLWGLLSPYLYQSRMVQIISGVLAVILIMAGVFV